MKTERVGSVEIGCLADIKSIVGKILDTQPLKNVPAVTPGTKYTYMTVGGEQRVVKVGSSSRFPTKGLPIFLSDMKLCDWHARVYSGDSKIFSDVFVKPLYGSLKCILDAKDEDRIPVFCVLDFLKWLPGVLKALRLYSSNLGLDIKKATEQLTSNR